jgi:outer membrane protein
MSVTGAYLQTVLNYQLAMVQEKRMNFTKEQKSRLELLYENKAATQLDLYELIAQHALDSAEYLRLIGDFEVAKNQLKQLLNLAPDSEFTVELFPKIVSKTLLEKPANLTTAPELNALDARQEIADLRKSNSQAQLIPTISVNGSLGTGYSGNNQQLINGNLQPKPLPVQMQENFYQSAVLSLTVPIFNQGNVRSDMERNKVEQLKISEERTFLSRELNYKIAQWHIEIQQFQNRIEALKIAQDAAQTALEMATLKYQSGHIKLVDLLETQQRHFQAESELTQARFQVHFKSEILGMFFW